MDEIATRLAAAAKTSSAHTTANFDNVAHRSKNRLRTRSAMGAVGIAAAVALAIAIPNRVGKGGLDSGPPLVASNGASEPIRTARTIDASEDAPSLADPSTQERVGAVADQLFSQFHEDFFASELNPGGPRFYFKGKAPEGAIALLESLDFRSIVVEHIKISQAGVDIAVRDFAASPGLDGTCQVEPPSITRLTWIVHCRTTADLASAREVAGRYLPTLPIFFDTDFEIVTLS